jgi:hypothetical protein
LAGFLTIEARRVAIERIYNHALHADALSCIEDDI